MREGWMYNDYTVVLAEGGIVWYYVSSKSREEAIGIIMSWETFGNTPSNYS